MGCSDAGEAAAQDRRVHGARRGSGKAIHADPGLFQQSVEHTPGESTMSAAPLQGKIDAHDWAIDRDHTNRV